MCISLVPNGKYYSALPRVVFSKNILVSAIPGPMPSILSEDFYPQQLSTCHILLHRTGENDKECMSVWEVAHGAGGFQGRKGV